MELLSEKYSFGFPFAIDEGGGVVASGGDEAIRNKIVQVLMTAPGERIHQPEFGCGLLNMVFEPNNSVLATTIQFTVSQALTRWLDEEMLVDSVIANSVDEYIVIEVIYTKKDTMQQQAVRVQFK